MRRREFLNTAGATMLLSSLPSVAEPEQELHNFVADVGITLEYFCRNVLKAKLYAYERYAIHNFDVNFQAGRIRQTLRIEYAKLAAYVALWAAYTHPENTVWIHGKHKYPEACYILAARAGNDVLQAYTDRVWHWNTRYSDWKDEGPKLDDFHIYL